MVQVEHFLVDNKIVPKIKAGNTAAGVVGVKKISPYETKPDFMICVNFLSVVIISKADGEEEPLDKCSSTSSHVGQLLTSKE